MKRIILLLIAIILSACGHLKAVSPALPTIPPPQVPTISGPQGSQGPAGTTGTDGSSPTLGSQPATSQECPNGGLEITSNGSVIGVECSGLNGATGPQGAAGQQGAPGVTTVVTVTPTPSPTPTVVQAIVSQYNEYQVSQGNDPITPGLRCTLYTVPNMPVTPCLLASSFAGCGVVSSSTGYASVATWTYTGTVNQPNEAGSAGFNMLPTALQSLYTANFAITCTGYFVNVDYNYHEFDTSSDDGSLLYIGGSLVVNNDGEHGITNVKGQKYLQAQVYSFQVNYFQGPGNVALIVNMDGTNIPAGQLYH
jgi:hypothetical protein